MTSNDAFTWMPLIVSLLALIVALILGGRQ
jgi:hypothetical protein